MGDPHYADLPYGRTKYAFLGPEDGRKVSEHVLAATAITGPLNTHYYYHV